MLLSDRRSQQANIRTGRLNMQSVARTIPTSKYLVVLVLFFSSGGLRSQAQPLGRYYRSVESIIAPAEFVAIGSIRSVKQRVLLMPGARDEFGAVNARGKVEYTLNPDFQEVVKRIGRVGQSNEFASLQTIDPNAGENRRLTHWAREGTMGLWVIHPQYPSEKFRRWEFIPFSELGINHFGYVSTSLQPPIFTRDLSLLRSREAIIESIREYGPISQREHRVNEPTVISIRIPHVLLIKGMETGSFTQLSLPIDSQLPMTARRLILSPGEIAPRAVIESNDYALDTLREAGIDLLGAMRTDDSVEMLKACLDPSKVKLEPSSNESRIRTQAYEKLLDWQINPPRPVFHAEVPRMYLSSTGINDQSLKLVGEFRNLEELYLWDTNITHAGIEHIAALFKLRLLAVDDTQLTNAFLEVLSRNDQLHLVSQATIEDSLRRPATPADVTCLRFWCAPFDDEALRYFRCFENITKLDLGRMDISDAGVEHLVNYKKLKFLRLHETKVSKQGFAKLREALPNCTIESQ